MIGNHFHHYQKERSKNYNYIDRVVKSYIEHGGALFHIHKLLATIDTNGNEKLIEDGIAIGDSVLNENPYRKKCKAEPLFYNNNGKWSNYQSTDPSSFSKGKGIKIDKKRV